MARPRSLPKRCSLCLIAAVLRADADQVHSSSTPEEREGRRRRITAGGVSQVVVLLFGLGTAIGAIFADGLEARNLVIVAVIMLGAFALSVRRDRSKRGQHSA
jgi:hypothetical protein